jgi:hypothetical protein
MFDATTGALLRTIPHPAPPRGAQFGFHLTPVGEYLAVSALGKNLGGNDVGAVYLFDAATADLVHILNTRSGRDDLFIGDRLAAVGNDVLVAATFQDIDGMTDVGEVYLFEGPPPGLRTIARTDFSEATLGASSFVPGPGNREIGFSTVVDPDSLGITPIAEVNHDGTINSPALIHQSLDATTTFDFVDLTGWQDVSVLVNLRVAINTFFEAGDQLRVVLQNGGPDVETIVLVDLMGATGTDALDALRDDGYSYYMAHVPSHWSEVRLVVTTSSNSSLDAERFEFDGIRIVGVHVIPEPPTALLALFGLLGLAGFTKCRRLHRIWPWITGRAMGMFRGRDSDRWCIWRQSYIYSRRKIRMCAPISLIRRKYRCDSQSAICCGGLWWWRWGWRGGPIIRIKRQWRCRPTDCAPRFIKPRFLRRDFTTSLGR